LPKEALSRSQQNRNTATHEHQSRLIIERFHSWSESPALYKEP